MYSFKGLLLVYLHTRRGLDSKNVILGHYACLCKKKQQHDELREEFVLKLNAYVDQTLNFNATTQKWSLIK